MLYIKKLNLYRIARYPKGVYCESYKHYPVKVITASMSSLALLTLLGTSCLDEVDRPPGLVGPPPLPPNYMTENEARIIIKEAFLRNGIQLNEDFPLSIKFDDRETITLDLDGYNPDLKVGYEYIHDDDSVSFTPEVVADLNEANTSGDDGPFVCPLYSALTPEEIESQIQEFISSLRAKGIL